MPLIQPGFGAATMVSEQARARVVAEDPDFILSSSCSGLCLCVGFSYSLTPSTKTKYFIPSQNNLVR